MSKLSKQFIKERAIKAGKASAAKRNKKYYIRFSAQGHKAQGLGKGSRPRGIDKKRRK